MAGQVPLVVAILLLKHEIDGIGISVVRHEMDGISVVRHDEVDTLGNSVIVKHGICDEKFAVGFDGDDALDVSNEFLPEAMW